MSATAKWWQVPEARLRLPERPRATIGLSGMIGFLSLIAAVSFGAIMGARHDGVAWDSQVFNRLTVQIMPEGLAPPPQEIPAAIAVLKSYPGVVSADVMPKSDNTALVAPWLGTAAAADDLPFPTLIDVKIGPGTGPDVVDLQRRLLATAPHAVVDDHRGLARQIVTPNPALWMAALLLAGTALAIVGIILSSMRARLSAHWPTLELLQLLGATEWRVAQLFETRPVIAVVTGCAAGTAAGAGIFALRALSGVPMPAAVPALTAGDLAWLAFIPVIAAIIAWLIAHFLVLSALRRR